MSIRTCHQVLANGAPCQGSPLRNRNYCRFHMQQIGRRMRAAQSRARGEPLPFKLPLLEDPCSVQIALMQLADALAAGEIDLQQLRGFTTVVRLAMQNFKHIRSWEGAQPLQLPRDTEGAVTEWPTFEQEYDLPEGLDLSLEPEVAFPPPKPGPQPESPLVAMARKVIGDAATTIPGGGFRVTAEDMEVWEIAERDGEFAGMERRARLEHNRERRERRFERMRYEELARNRNIQMAADALLWEREREQKAKAAEQAAVLTQIGPGKVSDAKAEAPRKPPRTQPGRPKAKAAELPAAGA